jgi:Raf kinase inhibitor-like YbhB/YbcL family protein
MTMTDGFELTSGAFEEGASIPARYTCDGDNASPPLNWTGAPPEAVSLSLILDDPDAGGFVHWVAYNLDASASGSLPAGVAESPDGPAQGTNSFGQAGYGGPCPPSGEHRYVFRLLALDDVLELIGAPSAEDVLEAAEGHVIGEATLTATYRRSR